MPFTYVIDTLPDQHAIFDFLQEQGPVDVREMYGNYNMGAGFALYVSPKDAMKVMDVGLRPQYDFHTVHAGHVESGDKKVVIHPVGIEFAAETLAVR